MLWVGVPRGGDRRDRRRPLLLTQATWGAGLEHHHHWRVMAEPPPAASESGGSTLGFFSLPPELRLHIYELVIESTFDAWTVNQAPSKHDLLGTLQLCTLSRVEAMPILFRGLCAARSDLTLQTQITECSWRSKHAASLGAHSQEAYITWNWQNQAIDRMSALVGLVEEEGWPTDKWSSAQGVAREDTQAGEFVGCDAPWCPCAKTKHANAL